MNNSEWLQEWYKSRCDGDWEHSHGVRIGTLDNPGWHVNISLQDTPFIDVPFEQIEREGKSDWIVCRKKEGSFEGFGDVTNLDELIGVFRSWIESQTVDVQTSRSS